MTIPPVARANSKQDLLYGSPEWQTPYNSLRNTNEGIHGFIKDPAHEALDDPARRRVHGVSAQSLFVAFLVVRANVRMIRAFPATSRTKRIRRPRPRQRTTEPLFHWMTDAGSVAVPDDPDPPKTA